MVSWLTKAQQKRFLLWIVPPVGIFLLRLIYLTCKKRFHGGNIPDDPCVIVFWHGELLMLPFCYLAKRPKDKMIASIISEHSDGEMIARIIKRFGGESIRGSSRKGAIKALKRAFEVIQEGKDIGVTPDGPKGPRHSVADGAVIVAQRYHVPVVTFNCKASRVWQFDSWDKMFLPKPFSTIDFYIGEPLSLDELDVDEAKKIVKERLMEHAF